MNEPPHVHVRTTKKGNAATAKIWIETGNVEEQGELTETQLNLCCRLIDDNREALLLQWEKAKVEKIKPIQL